jgi:oxygen-independent coproporphyrinogen-3 oxidase
MALQTDNPGLGVYVHWPFCAQKCPYCDFNSHVRFGGWDEDRFLRAYRRELSHTAARCGPKLVTSIFFGGGTPSLMRPNTVADILDHIARLWTVDAKAEITLEANPGSVEAARFSGYRAAGVNRVSVGVQSLSDEELKKLGRIHSAAEARAALKIAASTFERTSFDLIYARPGQTPACWRRELGEALALAGSHLSLYQLTIEPDTPYAGLHAAGKLVVPDAEAALALYETTQELTAAAGLPAYEISNHARPGDESRHNLNYWRYGEYVGVGPGAHGRLLVNRLRHATVAERHPETWVEQVERAGHGLTTVEALTADEEADEMLLMGLRLAEGLDLARLETVTGVRPGAKMVADLEARGLIERLSPTAHAGVRSGIASSSLVGEIHGCLGPGEPPERHDRQLSFPASRIRATPRGRMLLNEIVLRISASLGPAQPDAALTHP